MELVEDWGKGWAAGRVPEDLVGEVDIVEVTRVTYGRNRLPIGRSRLLGRWWRRTNPPLPTTPYRVIRIWDNDDGEDFEGEVYVLGPDMLWHGDGGTLTEQGIASIRSWRDV